jgi:hypothetical protein
MERVKFYWGKLGGEYKGRLEGSGDTCGAFPRAVIEPTRCRRVTSSGLACPIGLAAAPPPFGFYISILFTFTVMAADSLQCALKSEASA